MNRYHGATAVLACCLAGGPVQAVPLSSLLTPGATLTLDYLTLSGWGADGFDSTRSPGYEVDLSDIEVTAAAIDSATIEVRFDAGSALTAAGLTVLAVVDLSLTFTASFAGRVQLASVALGLDGYSVPGATAGSFVWIEEYLYADAAHFDFANPADNALVDRIKVEVDPSRNPAVTAAGGTLPALRNRVFVYKNTLSNADPGEAAGITHFTQRFTSVPEPGTWLLLVGGAGLWVARRGLRLRGGTVG